MDRINSVNRIVLTKEKFGKDLYEKVAQQLQILIEAGNLCSVYCHPKKKDFIVIEFVSVMPNFSEPYPYYLYPDEAEYVSLYVVKKNLAYNEEEVERLMGVIDDIENSDLRGIIDDILNKTPGNTGENNGGGLLN